MTPLEIAHSVLAEIDAGRPDAERIVALAKAVVEHASAVTVPVATCAECPFVYGDEQPWLCAEPTVGYAARTIGFMAAPFPPPPAWCPLREADRLVTLRAK